MTLPLEPPISPMLAKSAETIPRSGGFLFEPKWDGFRCIVFRDGSDIVLGSRNTKPLTRYFPELMAPLMAALPERAIVDGELVAVTPDGLDFDVLGQRIHPAQSRIDMLAATTPATFVAFDMLAEGDELLLERPFGERRQRLVDAVVVQPGLVHLTPISDDADVADSWFRRFEGAGFDGVVAKPVDGTYQPGKRALVKIKHQREMDVVVAGYRVHKDGAGVGSLLLGLMHDGHLQHVGVASSFSTARRAELVDELAPYVLSADEVATHPWGEWAQAQAHEGGARMPGAPNRWSGQKDHSWVPMAPKLVAEVGYQQLTHGRLRHPARFIRWRPDRDPDGCTYDQLDVEAPPELSELFG